MFGGELKRTLSSQFANRASLALAKQELLTHSLQTQRLFLGPVDNAQGKVPPLQETAKQEKH